MTVTFQNKGLIDLRGITTFGVCAKVTDNPIGYFGTGLKYAIAVLLREGLKVTMYHGTLKCKFTAKTQTIREQEFHIVQMNGSDLAFTTELGKNWKLWMAYRELAANAMDEEGGFVDYLGDFRGRPCNEHTTFIVEGDAIDKIHAEHDQIFLQSKPKWSLEGLDIHDDIGGGGWLYYRGIRVYELSKPAMYNYNLTCTMRLTEDRTLTSLGSAFQKMAKAIAKCDNAELIRHLLLANQRYFESTIDYNWWSFSSDEVFNKVVQGYISSGTSFNTSARALYRSDHPEDTPPDTIQLETIPIEQRRKLWAALLFWDKLGFAIPKGLIHVTTELGEKKGKAIGGHIYLSKFVLEMDMRRVTGILYKLYSDTRPEIGDVKQQDLLLDTVVDFGERLLGVQKKEKAA